MATQMKPCLCPWMGSDCLEVGGDWTFLDRTFGFAAFRANEKGLSKVERWRETGETGSLIKTVLPSIPVLHFSDKKSSYKKGSPIFSGI